MAQDIALGYVERRECRCDRHDREALAVDVKTKWILPYMSPLTRGSTSSRLLAVDDLAWKDDPRILTKAEAGGRFALEEDLAKEGGVDQGSLKAKTQVKLRLPV